jgi:hypothetical protein
VYSHSSTKHLLRGLLGALSFALSTPGGQGFIREGIISLSVNPDCFEMLGVGKGNRFFRRGLDQIVSMVGKRFRAAGFQHLDKAPREGAAVWRRAAINRADTGGVFASPVASLVLAVDKSLNWFS